MINMVCFIINVLHCSRTLYKYQLFNVKFYFIKDFKKKINEYWELDIEGQFVSSALHFHKLFKGLLICLLKK